jgi:hypothetical protein
MKTDAIRVTPHGQHLPESIERVRHLDASGCARGFFHVRRCLQDTISWCLSGCVNVAACVQQSRSLIENEGALQSIAFVERFDRDVIMFPVIGLLPKEKAAKVIRFAAEEHEADYVLYVDALTLKHGEARAMTGATGLVIFQFETLASQFYAQAQRETAHDAAGNRYSMFGNVSFALAPIVSGCFMGRYQRRGAGNERNAISVSVQLPRVRMERRWGREACVRLRRRMALPRHDCGHICCEISGAPMTP